MILKFLSLIWFAIQIDGISIDFSNVHSITNLAWLRKINRLSCD